MKSRLTARHGLTLIELLVGLILLSILAAALMGLFRTSWLSYQNLVWQSKVNMEARRALDDLCDTLRMAGANVDLTSPKETLPQVSSYPSSDANLITITRPPGYLLAIRYRSQALPAHDNQDYLQRVVGANWNNAKLVGQHIKSIEFEYEYRLPAATENDTAWQSVRVSRPGNAAAYLAHTVYVTVTAEVSPFGNNGATYTRRLTSAVHLRGPYNTRIPRAKYTTLPYAPAP